MLVEVFVVPTGTVIAQTNESRSANQEDKAPKLTAEERAEAAKLMAEAKSFERAISLMEKHMTVAKDGTLMFDKKGLEADIKNGAAKSVDPAVLEKHLAAAEDGALALDEKGLEADIKNRAEKNIAPEVFEDLEASLKQTNVKLRSGEMKASDIFPTSANKPSEQDGVVGPAYHYYSCWPGYGWNGTWYYWWGTASYLDDCKTHWMTDLMRSGAGLGTLCGIFAPWLGPYYSAACAGISFLLFYAGPGYIDWVDRYGNHWGIYYGRTWAGQSWVWHA